MEWAGYQKLRPGRIHVYCPKCGRKLSNAHRGEFDPPKATLVHTWCVRCGSGGKDSSETFFDARGKEIDFRVVLDLIDKKYQVAALGPQE
jgi:ribosomal protein L37E